MLLGVTLKSKHSDLVVCFAGWMGVRMNNVSARMCHFPSNLAKVKI